MKGLKKYKLVFIIAFLILIVLIVYLINKPEEVESIEVYEPVVFEKEEVSNTIKFEIKGAIKNNGVYEIEEDARIIDAIKLGGGVLKDADTNNINLSAKLTDAMVIDIPYQEEYIKKVIKVDIKGAIKNPGVYQMNENDRIIDVIKLSGGLIEKADTDNINLSKKVFDEMVIIIPMKEEIADNEVNKEPNNKETDILDNDALIGKEQDNEIEEDSSLKNEDKTINQNTKISINTATKEQLMTLSGIGESKALAIIEYRNIKRFESIEELTKVKGIGNSIYEKIKDNITL